MDEKKKKELKKDLMALISRHMKKELVGTVEGMWEDGPFSVEYEDEESELMAEYKIDPEDEGYEENHDAFMESFSECLTDIQQMITECFEERGSYPHKIYEDGVCIAKFHVNAENEAHELWDEVTKSTNDFSAKFETIDEDGNEVTKTLD